MEPRPSGVDFLANVKAAVDRGYQTASVSKGQRGSGGRRGGTAGDGDTDKVVVAKWLQALATHESLLFYTLAGPVPRL